jgi:hypothetical protein
VITFDEASHTYRDSGGRLVPGVTFMLQSVGASPRLPNFRGIVKARERGSAVHRAIDLFSTATLDFSSLKKEYEGWFNAFLDWYGQCGLRRIRHEVIVVGEGTRYAGRVDLIGTARDGGEVTVDFKTGRPEECHPIQVTLYALARNRERGKGLRRCLVYLRGDGTWTQRDVKEAVTVTRALAVVEAFEIDRARRMKAYNSEIDEED